MQKRRFVKRLHEEKQAEDTTGRREQFNPNDEEFFKDEVDIFHEKREMALDRSGLLEPADSSSEDDERVFTISGCSLRVFTTSGCSLYQGVCYIRVFAEEEVLGLGLKDSEDEEDLITQKEQLEDEELEEDEERGIVPFGEKEQKLLQRFEKYLHSDDEEVHPDEEMGNIVSDKAWGKKKSIFYHTDYVDDEMGGSEEEEMAEEEEKEGLALQQRMAEEVDEEAYLAPEKSVGF
jgi:hypothetical protein